MVARTPGAGAVVRGRSRVKLLLASGTRWPVIAAPVLLIGLVLLLGGEPHGVVAGVALILGWLLTWPFGAAVHRWRLDPAPGRQLVAAGWALAVLLVTLGGLGWGMWLDPGV